MLEYHQQLLLVVVQELFYKRCGDTIEVTNIDQCFGGVINSVYFLDCLIQELDEIVEISLVVKIYSGSVQEQHSKIIKDFFVYNLLFTQLDENNNNNFTTNYTYNIEKDKDNMAWFLQNRHTASKSLCPFALLWNLASSEQLEDEGKDVETYLSRHTLVVMTKLEGSPLNMIRSEPSFKHFVYAQVCYQFISE